MLNSSNAHICNNTFMDSRARFGLNERSAGGDHFVWHPGTGPHVDERNSHSFMSSFPMSDHLFDRPLPFTWQRPLLCKRLNDSMLDKRDRNVYVHGITSRTASPIIWSPVQAVNCQGRLVSFETLRERSPLHAIDSTYLQNCDGPLCRGVELRKGELLPKFAEFEVGALLPDSASRYLKNFRSWTARCGSISAMTVRSMETYTTKHSISANQYKSDRVCTTDCRIM